MRVLVIGSEGNIGAPLVARLRSSGHEVYATDIRAGWRPEYAVADITHPLDLLGAFDWRPDAVVLMAAMVSRVTCEASPSLAVATNVAGTANVVELARRAGARLLYVSTSEVYGPTDGPMDEASTPCRPNNRYGLTKLMGEQLVRYESGLDAVVVRPFMVYGEDETPGDHRSFMVRCAQSLAAGLPVDVHDGTWRSWMHVSDAVAALERAVMLPGPATVNIGHPEVRSVRDVAESVARALGSGPGLIRVLPQPARMTPVKRPALGRQRDLLGFTPSVGLDEGIGRLCARYAGAAA